MDTYKPVSSRLRSIPKDVYDIIIDEQAHHKKKFNTKLNIEQTIYQIIKRPRWGIITSKPEYQAATERFEQVNDAKKESPDHSEKLLLGLLISTYEGKAWDKETAKW